ncbi:unnamed protein product [Agarophyton chilense]
MSDSGTRVGGVERATRIILSRPPESDEQFDDDATPSFEAYLPPARDLSLLRKNPLVPAGALTTAAVLGIGLLAFRAGNTRLSQTMMRARVVAQAATLVVLGASVVRPQNSAQ